jgi:hypothetical protein
VLSPAVLTDYNTSLNVGYNGTTVKLNWPVPVTL